MARSRMKVPVLALCMGLLFGACGGGGEEETLIRSYFQAARFGDRDSLNNIAMYGWDTAQRGIVSRPSVESVSEEQSRPLRMVELSQALAEAEEAEEVFTQEKIVYQDENFDAINRVLEAEREGNNLRRRADREVQEAWTDWRDRTIEHSRTVAAARDELNAERNEAQLSMFDPNNPIDERMILEKRSFRHIVHDVRHVAWLVGLFRFIQGRRRTWHCGAHTLVNSQETCLVTGLAAARQLGADYPFDDPAAKQWFNYYGSILYGRRFRRA